VSHFLARLYHLDDLDMKIIREIDSPNSPRWKVRVSYGEISRKLGVDEETIRLRVKRARERGAFPTWRLMVNPHLLDCDQVSLELEVDAEERKPQAISQIKLVDGVTKIVNYRGKGLEVTLYSQGGASLARQVRLIESICGSRHSSLWTSRFPRPAVQLRKLDWKIVKALGDDVAGDLDEVAKSLGVSTRTVQRRLQAMTEGKAVFLSGAPRVDAVGGVACCFVVFCPEGRGKGPLDATIRAEFGRVGHIDTSPEEYSHIGVPCENLAEADRLLNRLKAVDGVREVSMHIMSEILLVREWLGGEVDRRLSGA
jgi:DNA-binding Lrp family transcriptional regulator